MSLLALFSALLLEQWRPLSDRRHLFAPAARYAGFLEGQFNAGERQHGIVAWLAMLLPPVLCSWLAYAVLLRANPLLALIFNIGALYVTMGFRQFSHYFTDIHLALKEDDLGRARAILTQWRGHSCAELDREEVVRLTIEASLAATHRHVFAVIFWFVLLPGPTGPILYRLSSYLNTRWGRSIVPEMLRFGAFARQVFDILEWLPARFTAVSFAVVGDFEDAVYCWRTQAGKWADKALGIVMASGAGAIGVRLGNPVMLDRVPVDRPELGIGDAADIGHVDSTIGLVWRALVLWMLVLLMLSFAKAFS
ncbi:MAG: CobD/CbiB family protein [Betaproteobacteria bacterium]|nr:CobD/CbiB family protein [Betaproteobacteria bacterium]